MVCIGCSGAGNICATATIKSPKVEDPAAVAYGSKLNRGADMTDISDLRERKPHITVFGIGRGALRRIAPPTELVQKA